MPRFALALLVGLVLAASSWAQEPDEKKADEPAPSPELPMPTPVTPVPVPATPVPVELPPLTPAPPRLRVRNLGAKLGDDFELPVGVLVPEPDPEDWRFWARADYAFAFIKGKSLPPLATTSPAGTSQAAAGVLGLPTTSVLIGGEPITGDLRSMGRLELGMWFGPEKNIGVAAGAFITDSKGTTIGASSDGSTIIARPLTDAATGTPTSVLVAYPGVASGSVAVSAAMQTFWGANLDLRANLLCEPWFHVEGLVGYRYLHYGESLAMQQTVNPLGAVFVAGTQIVSSDSFQTSNDFHGGEAGFRAEIEGERWSIGLLTKVAAGGLLRTITINGNTQVTAPGVGAAMGAGGVYALSSNIGSYSRDSFVIAPEAGLDFSYQVCPHVRLRVGYSFLFLQGIARAADQINFTVNPNLFPPAVGGGPNQPAFNFVRSDIWIQTINLGVEVRF